MPVGNCSDGLHTQGETDIDCGGICSAACVTCFSTSDGALDHKGRGCETYMRLPDFCGSDDDDTDFSSNTMCCACGGGLIVPEACSDGLRTLNEMGIDCGGVCGAACGTCTDGTQNGDEHEVDCGGSCPGCGGQGRRAER